MQNGTVKFFNETKGFGFIKAENGEEIFVHSSGLKEQIRETTMLFTKYNKEKKV